MIFADGGPVLVTWHRRASSSRRRVVYADRGGNVAPTSGRQYCCDRPALRRSPLLDEDADRVAVAAARSTRTEGLDRYCGCYNTSWLAFRSLRWSGWTGLHGFVDSAFARVP
jgi:hypothetical protein